ncbi:MULTISPECIES: LppP/LprE family lipoprotein [unclassified Nocardia]|uniref:LppP/LprE family lipoprotein n=1 Tax=unclassified Nocardia TaxID=2637762 RepID=UPI00278C5CE7|nr:MULTISPECIES: LppP/LprE family lipoprotein [unclassified Nocardia]
MNKLIGTGLAAFLVAGAVAGCEDATTPPGPGSPAPGPSEPGTVTGTAAPTITSRPDQPPVTTSPPADGLPATAGSGLCLDPGSDAVTAAIASLGPSVGGDPYTFDSSIPAAVGECPDLLWAMATTPGGTASSPYHVLFFNHDGYLGTATSKATSYTSVVGSSDRAVQVQYRWLKGDDANCCPSGGPAVITFTLGSDGATVTPNPSIPDEVANPSAPR